MVPGYSLQFLSYLDSVSGVDISSISKENAEEFFFFLYTVFNIYKKIERHPKTPKNLFSKICQNYIFSNRKNISSAFLLHYNGLSIWRNTIEIGLKLWYIFRYQGVKIQFSEKRLQSFFPFLLSLFHCIVLICKTYI